MKKVTIIGYGRFGKTLHKLLKDDFDVMVYLRKKTIDKEFITTDLKKAYGSEVIFYAVPISSFEDVISAQKKFFKPKHLLIDVLSVKLHPKNIFEKYLPEKTQALLTHPMFGPDSSREGFDGLPIILDQYKTSEENYTFWKKFFVKKNLNILEMNSDDHDRLAANSQGLTHFIGRLLDEFGTEKSSVDTIGAKKLMEVREQVCNDTWKLFIDLQHFNPYTKEMRIKLGASYDNLYNKLIPKQANKEFITIGIQGGKGSFNEEAIEYYVKRNKIDKYKIKYLHTSESVLNALHVGDIDLGQFAIHNSTGGIVGESIDAMAKYKFRIVEEFAIIISHALMIRKDAKLSDIDTIMTHPQVLAQCKTNLSEKYPNLKQTSGEGELIDHALVAKHLSEGKIAKNIGTMGSKILAEIYGLQIVEDNLQDLAKNFTSFLVVER
ncbi:MAG TPA: prephenate dehydrogenase/arogenate dehydrogenase family protein [Candidatus Saccharimonadales bacterium]|nr:prephenate dehydrogenase/arogenate dehydrogenase family protein [Candidatus Saccharimonadales bacterium]